MAIYTVIRNTAKLEDVMAVKRMLDRTDTLVAETQCIASLQLGDVQSAFAAFDNALADYRHFVETDYHNRKIKVIRKQITAQKSLLQKTVNQMKIGEI